MNKPVTLFITLIFYCLPLLRAQQLPLVAQHAEFHGLINPASLNSDFLMDGRNVSMGASWRQQWVQLGELSPSTKVVRGEYIDSDHRFLVGGYVVHDKVGITNNFGVYGRAAYIIPTSDGTDLTDGGISIGLNMGIVNWALRTEHLSVNQLDDPNLPYKTSSWYPDLGFGAYWYYNLGSPSHYFYIGVSAPRTFEFRNDYLGAKRLPHYYALAGYVLPLLYGEGSYIEASAWSRYVENIPLQSSFHIKLQALQYAWLGIGTVTDFKSQAFLLVEAGVNLPFNNNGLKIGYSYTWGSFLNHFGATHEFNMAFVMDTRN